MRIQIQRYSLCIRHLYRRLMCTDNPYLYFLVLAGLILHKV